MTRPLPVTAYAAVSPDGRLDCDTVGRSEETAKIAAAEWYEAEISLTFLSVTILSQKQFEAMVEAARGVEFTYTNWRGETSKRRVLPVRFWFGSTKWHKERQRMMTAFDLDKGEMRDFAVDDIDWQNNAALDRALAALKEQDHG